ncbi:ATPase [Cephaloticoccus capnophilus]|uniref:histidine kinase n=1 Tax=Cephaloticoccus capnophilus TaxID=1548208 RepID=A0A139SK60_9BACT|nr:HAMP domain-containing sensor histidine kinase [Cephaloticoccus capnophilus]KXU34877.1 ATPase [Cephaloticoccus capnophilus]
MQTHASIQARPPLSRRARTLWLAGLALVMAAIFSVDTTTHYEVAAAVFYTLVVLIAARVLRGRALLWLAVWCIGLSVFSFALTPHGDLHAGLINLAISITAIIMVAWLVIKMEAARDAAHAAQAQLLRLARVKRLDGLTTAIAHEVNQPLAAIVTSGHACQRWLGQDPPKLAKAELALNRILADAARASQIVTRVRSLSRGEPVQAVAFDFNAAVMEVLALSTDELERHGIELALELAGNLPRAFADPVQIGQVIGNLLLNAIEAMADKPDKAHVLRVGSILKEDTMILTVADSGAGIPAEIQAHLFDAFWTTKADGIGVGLSISRTMIEANGGQIWAESAPNGGAVFSISVPVEPRP